MRFAENCFGVSKWENLSGTIKTGFAKILFDLNLFNRKLRSDSVIVSQLIELYNIMYSKMLKNQGGVARAGLAGRAKF